MKKNLARILALLLCLVMLFSICACSKKGSGDDSGDEGQSSGGKPGDKDKNKDEGIKNDLKGVEKVRLEHVYKSTPVSVDLGENENINRINYVDGKVYMVSNYWDGYEDETTGMWVDESGTKILLFDTLTGESSVYADLKNTYEVPEEYKDKENTYYSEYANNHFVAEDGTIWLTKEIYFEDYSDPENYVYTQEYFFQNINAEGELLAEYDFKSEVDEEYFYPGRMFFADGKVVCTTGDKIYIFSQDMKLETTLQYKPESYMYNFGVTGNGDIICVYSSYDEVDNKSEYALVKIDIGAKNLIELPIDEDVNIVNMTILDGPGDKVYFRDNNAIYEYDSVSGKLTEKLNWMNSDINSFRLRMVQALENDQFLISESTPDYTKTNFYMMSPVGESEIVEKYVMTLAAVYPYDEIRDSILEFNKQSEEFRIILKDYSIYDNEENWSAGQEKLNQDMIAGEIPDILIVDQLPFENYASKGLLADLSVFMEKDSTFDRSNYLENILDSTSVNGKLYSIIPRFTVFTLAGRADVVGTEMGWTVEDLMRIHSEYPDAEVIAEETRDGVLRYFSSMALSSFVDYETGECKFNSPDFVKLLEFINTFPEEIDWDEYYENLPDDYWETYGDRFREYRVLLMTTYISYVDYIKSLEYELGGEATFIGFPSPEGIGASIRPEGEIAISSKTKMPGACWDFVKVMLSEQYQKNLTYGFPVHKAALEELFTEATKAEEITDDPEILPGEDIIVDDAIAYDVDIAVDDVATGDLGYDDYWSKPVSQAQADKVMALLTSVTTVERQNTELLKIIDEEAGAFFAGQKSAQAVADAIQSRAWIYVSENS